MAARETAPDTRRGSDDPAAVTAPSEPDALFLPVTAVTCLEDRAQIERTGAVQLAAGVQRLRIGPVTPLTVDRSLRAEIVSAAEGADAGARVVDARVVRTYTPPAPGRPGPDAGPALARVVNLVPCALWRPAYRATLAADRGSVLLETDAFVWQDTGEDWTGVRLSLSTARPTLAAAPPVLAEDVLALRERTT